MGRATTIVITNPDGTVSSGQRFGTRHKVDVALGASLGALTALLAESSKFLDEMYECYEQLENTNIPKETVRTNMETAMKRFRSERIARFKQFDGMGDTIGGQ